MFILYCRGTVSRIVSLLSQDLERSGDKLEAGVGSNEDSLQKMNQILDRVSATRNIQSYYVHLFPISAWELECERYNVYL